MFKDFFTFIDSILARDPAARTGIEVILLYPGVHALGFYRIANVLYRARFFFFARMVSQTGRWITGIEIHPGARIGQRLFIDHGNGVVIGETAEIGDDVTMYHQVTLGGSEIIRGKRHPTICDRVTIGAGAKIVGAVTVGAGATIGANAVVVHNVPEGVTVGGVPAQPLSESLV